MKNASRLLIAIVCSGAFGLCLVAMAYGFVGSAFAQSSANFQIEQPSFNAGGHPVEGVVMSSMDLAISLDSLGEAVAGGPMVSASFQLDCGAVAVYQFLNSPCAIPPELQGAAMAADKATFSWSPAATATRYDVVRGSLAALPVGPGGDEACFDNLAAATMFDPTLPAADSGFWYLSRGENACGIGSYGFQGSLGAPGTPRITTTCP